MPVYKYYMLCISILISYGCFQHVDVPPKIAIADLTRYVITVGIVNLTQDISWGGICVANMNYTDLEENKYNAEKNCFGFMNETQTLLH